MAGSFTIPAMKILVAGLDLRPPPIGGIWACMEGYFGHLARREGVEMVGLGPDLPGASSVDRALGFPILREPFPQGHYLRRVPHAAAAIRRAVRKTKPDAVLVEPWYPIGPGAAFGADGVPFWIVLFGTEVLSVRRWDMRLLLRACLRRAEGVIAISEYTAELARKAGARPERVEVVNPGLELSRFAGADRRVLRDRLSLGERPVVGTLARLVRRKGMDTVIRSLGRVLEAVPEALYLVGGDGPARPELESLARSLGLEQHVRFLGPVDDRDVPHFYAACDVFAMVSRVLEEDGDVEGYGIVYLEANACGVPVVAGRSGGVPEAVKEGETGLLVDPRDVEGLARALTRLLNDPGERERMREPSKRWAAAHSWSRSAAQLHELIEKRLRRLETAPRPASPEGAGRE